MLHRVAAALDSISGRADQGPERGRRPGRIVVYAVKPKLKT
jgi:hypothetical protein